MATDIHQGFVEGAPRVLVCPERLSSATRSVLAIGDAAITLCVSAVALSSAQNPAAAAVLTAGIICGVFWACGLYRRSYAVAPRDEVYYACTGVLFAALPIAAILASVGELSLLRIAAALILSAAGTSAWRIRMNAQRRAGSVPYAGINSITPHGWHDCESQAFVVTKRCFDVVVACAALIVTFPVMLVAAAAIALESRAPVLFKQQRVGQNGRVFLVYKLRTMKPNAGAEWARPGDSRITRLGGFLRRTSIDELPQVFNVLRGEMSIVGPRPEMVEFAREFAAKMPAYDQRHIVPPGITGWAQLYHKRNLNPDDVREVLPYDLFYVEHSSLVLDTAILLKTVAEVLFHRAV